LNRHSLPEGTEPRYLLGRFTNQREIRVCDQNVELGIPKSVHGNEFPVQRIRDVEQLCMRDKAALDTNTAHFEYIAAGISELWAIRSLEAFTNSNIPPSGHTSKSSSRHFDSGVSQARESPDARITVRAPFCPIEKCRYALGESRCRGGTANGPSIWIS
jgi:hypothetical protein